MSAAVLLQLAERCEREEPSETLDAAIFLALGKIKFEKQQTWDAPVPLETYARWCVDHWRDQYTRNVAAAVTIVPLENGAPWFWRVGFGSERPGWAHLNRFHASHCDRRDEVTAYAKTPALALCAAALRARGHEAEAANG